MSDKDLPLGLVIDGTVINVVDVDGAPMPNFPMPTWTMSDTAICTVNPSADGVTARIFPQATGDCTLTVLCGTAVITKTVTVTPKGVGGFEVTLSDPHAE